MRQDENLNEKIVVSETIKEEIIKTGKLGNYLLKGVKIKGKNNFIHFSTILQCPHFDSIEK